MSITSTEIWGGLTLVLLVHSVSLTITCFVAKSLFPLLAWCALGVTIHTIHRLGHSEAWRDRTYGLWQYPARWLKIWWHAHTVGHHGSNYPTDDFLSPIYRVNRHDPLVLNTWTYISTCIGVMVALIYISDVSIYVALVATVQCGLFGWLENVLHHQIHLCDSILAQYVWFRALQHLHMLHHTKPMQTNFTIAQWIFDLFLGTLQIVAEPKSGLIVGKLSRKVEDFQ